MLKLKLSRQIISKNLQLYLPFLLANAVLVGINYIFFSMTTNKSLEKQNYGSVLIQLCRSYHLHRIFCSRVFYIALGRFVALALGQPA